MADVFNVTASYDKLAYNAGDVMTITISGNDVLTSQVQTQQQSGTLTLTITAADGATTTIQVPPTTVTVTTNNSTPESVKITGIVDTSGRNWTIATGGLTATATA